MWCRLCWPVEVTTSEWDRETNGRGRVARSILFLLYKRFSKEFTSVPVDGNKQEDSWLQWPSVFWVDPGEVTQYEVPFNTTLFHFPLKPLTTLEVPSQWDPIMVPRLYLFSYLMRRPSRGSRSSILGLYQNCLIHSVRFKSTNDTRPGKM